jgi:hypothetical protein
MQDISYPILEMIIPILGPSIAAVIGGAATMLAARQIKRSQNLKTEVARVVISTNSLYWMCEDLITQLSKAEEELQKIGHPDFTAARKRGVIRQEARNMVAKSHGRITMQPSGLRKFLRTFFPGMRIEL